MDNIDVVARMFVRSILAVSSAASFAPQISRIRRRQDCDGISLFYILFNLIVATYHFSLALDFVIINWEGTYLVHQPPDLRDWLNLLQFGVVFVGHLILVALSLSLPLHRQTQKVTVGIIYMAFLSISLFPIALGAAVPKDERLWFSSSITGVLLYFLGPLVQVLGVAALFVQAIEVRQRHSPGALSIKSLTVQAFVFAIVGVSFVFRLQLPDENWECPGESWQCVVIGLRDWYWNVGWATINNCIFALAQGILALIASRNGTTDAAERQPLL